MENPEKRFPFFEIIAFEPFGEDSQYCEENKCHRQSRR